MGDLENRNCKQGGIGRERWTGEPCVEKVIVALIVVNVGESAVVNEREG